MAKLATQIIAIEISVAVPDTADDSVEVLEQESIDQLREAVEAMVGDHTGAVVEVKS